MRLENLKTLFGRGLQLKCPVCGEGRLFRGFFTMETNCPNCGLIVEREPGFFLGAIYINYGITSVLTIGGYAALRFGTELSSRQILSITLVAAVLIPILFFRYARSLWMAFDQWHDPRSPD